MPYPESLASELRSALAHLHDPAFLENHPLASRIGLVAQAPDLTRGELLRRTLRLSIEALDPEGGLPATSREARPYQVLRGRYILRQSLGEVAAQLDIGHRQAFRELRRAVEALAQMLRDGGLLDGDGETPLPGNEKTPGPVARLRAEVERLANVSRQDVDLGALLGQAVASAQRLAREQGKEIELSLGASGLHAAVNRVMLRQAILNLLSHAVHVHQGNRLPVRLYRSGVQAAIRFTYRPGAQSSASLRPGQPYAVAAQLLDALHLEWRCHELADGQTQVSIGIPLTQEHPVLIIDDNEGLIRLFERYLEGQPYQVSGATSFEQARAILDRLQPEVIILDVMMPERDGWEILEWLRQGEAGRQPKVLVCSIINDPQLAAALGADGFLHKPVDRLSLLQALARLVPPEA